MLALRGHHLPTTRIAAGAVVWEFGVVFTYLFNGVMDTEEDQVNLSRRPIAQGLLRPATARRMAATVAAAALVGGFALGIAMGLLVSVELALGYLYSGPPCYLKRGVFTGGMTGILGGLLTYVAGLTVCGGTLLVSRLAFFAIAMSLWMGLVGSVTKDLSDVAGDAAAGRRTAALMVGETKARLAASVVAFAVATTFLAIAISLARMLVWPAITLECGAIALTIVCLPRLSLGNFSFRRRPYRAFMVTQYAAHLSFIAMAAYSILR